MKKTIVALAAAAAICTSIATAQAKSGGNIVVTYQNNVSTLDPAIGYDWQNWTMIRSLFDGLMDYKHGTTELTPDLAKSYQISNDGKTYTFELRPNVKFSNGRTMTADDVKYSLNRAVDPNTKSPGSSFFASIEGYEQVASGKAKALSGVKVLSPTKIQISLSHPDATFLNVLALNFAFVVPKEAVAKWGNDFGKHPVGTGAYILKKWDLGRDLVFVKNPHYYHAGVPSLDQITFEIGQDPSVSLMRLDQGGVDIAGDGVPPARFLQVRHTPKYKGLLFSSNQLQTGYITMKTTIKPFDNLKVRQAVNMAINKVRIQRIINGRAAIANQPLPPGMLGYDPDYKGYPYDIVKARKLLAEAGYPNGFTTQLYVMNTDPQPRIAQSIQQDLAQVGIKAQIKSLAQANVIAAAGSKDQAPMVWSGGMAWLADFPDPADFYFPILSCSSAVDGGWNWARYCNKALDAQANKANAMILASEQKERGKMWKDIFDKVMKDAPWVPIFNEKRYVIRSKRMGGPDSAYVDPMNIPVDYDYIQLK